MFLCEHITVRIKTRQISFERSTTVDTSGRFGHNVCFVEKDMCDELVGIYHFCFFYTKPGFLYKPVSRKLPKNKNSFRANVAGRFSTRYGC